MLLKVSSVTFPLFHPQYLAAAVTHLLKLGYDISARYTKPTRSKKPNLLLALHIPSTMLNIAAADCLPHKLSRQLFNIRFNLKYEAVNILVSLHYVSIGKKKRRRRQRSKPSVRNITHQGSPWRGEDLSLECQGYVLVSDDDRSGCPSTVRDPAWLCIRPFGCGPLLSRHHVQLRQASLPHLTNQSRTDSIFLVDYNHSTVACAGINVDTDQLEKLQVHQ
ncbi:hypothetical protein DER46DRAFT_577905 [Fusarium sp. MPI-SDFR-AT-0072]|nr:hypothetical protein DER46DRAFT_577905 [Fusarium sp. MPI-SDFR-AT-0072]